ncbi:MAG: DUF1847 domain-containing protein [Thermodesulfobacteriota bacterium]
MNQCAECGVYACRTGKIEVAPQSCPMHTEGAIYGEAEQEYLSPGTREIALNSALTESEGYCKWTRLEEIVVFAHRSGFDSLGLAFCLGLRKEAAEVVKILKGAGFNVESVACKTGAVPKEKLGVKDEEKVRPGQFEAMCNPICQAKLLNSAKTQLNILLGLCVGHDTLFLQHSKAPTTILAVKDRVLAHNPLGAIYAGFYFSKRLAALKDRYDDRDETDRTS